MRGTTGATRHKCFNSSLPPSTSPFLHSACFNSPRLSQPSIPTFPPGSLPHGIWLGYKQFFVGNFAEDGHVYFCTEKICVMTLITPGGTSRSYGNF
eukprot:590614-Hanusia_phi.AAC.1